jgi:hypothetical protein
MANGRIRLLSAIPGPTSLSPIVRDFAKRREGVVTAFSDALLPICAQLIGEDSLIEVKPFGELVRQTLEMCGEEASPIAQQGQCLAAVAHVLGEVDEASPFWKTRDFSGLHESLWTTLKELREWGIDAEELERLRGSVNPRLTAKLDDLAGVSRRVDQILYAIGRQTHGAQLAACLEGAAEKDGTLERLLVFAGSDDNPMRIEWIKWLAAGGADVTVVVDRHATGAPLFEGARNMIRRLGVPAKEMGDANRLARNLFTEPEHGGPPIQCQIVSTADPLAEVEWALRGCSESGELTESAIFVRNLETYAPLIEIAAKRLGVPIRMARRAPLLTNAFARLTLTTLQFCASNDVRTIAPIVRSSYLGLASVEKAELDSEIKEAHGSRASQWATLEAWSELNQERFPWLLKVLSWRKEALASSATIAEWTDRLRTLIGVLPWHEAVAATDAYSTDRDRRAQNQLQRVLASHATVDQATEPTPRTLAAFTLLCQEIWQAADVSLPMNDYGVTVAAGTENLGEVQNLFVLGMLEGVFPRRRREDPILTDDERAEISSLRKGAEPLLTSGDVARAERDEFYRVCAAPKQRIVFSYPLTDDEQDNIPAYYLDKVREAAGQVSERNRRRSELAPSAEECESAADLALRHALDGSRESPLTLELTTEAAREAIIPLASEAFRPDELRDALVCPFMEVSRYRLKLRPKRRGARWYSLRKLPQAATLPTQMSADQAESALILALEAELDGLYSDVPEWEMQLLMAGGRRLIRDWVRREFAAREHWAKDPGSTLMNVGFGTHGLRDTLPGEVRITGVVPALSSMDNTSVLHLYGGAPRDASDLADPEKLFLGIHFLALHQQGREGALEIDGTGSKRGFYLLSRAGTRPLIAQARDGLEVKDLSRTDDPAVSKKIFFDEVKSALRKAISRISEGRIDATSGDHCDNCDYGELCRRSKTFGEEDSPFGIDEETGDV